MANMMPIISLDRERSAMPKRTKFEIKIGQKCRWTGNCSGVKYLGIVSSITDSLAIYILVKRVSIQHPMGVAIGGSYYLLLNDKTLQVQIKNRWISVFPRKAT